MAKIKPISVETIERMKKKSILATPNNPSERGLSAEAIKKKMVSPLFDSQDSLVSEVNRVVEEINNADFSSGSGTTPEGTTDHSALDNLDYENSGHTGFASSKDLEGKQNTLISGRNIKTFNGRTVLGMGDLVWEDPMYVANMEDITEDVRTSNGAISKDKKIYRIFSTNYNYWSFKLTLTMNANSAVKYYNLDLPEKNPDKNFIDFQFLNIIISEGGYEAYATYMIDGVLYNKHIHQEGDVDPGIYTVGDLTITSNYGNIYEAVDVSARTIFIKYADDVAGTNMSSVYNNQKYMGTFIGTYESATPSDYTWVKFVSELTTVTDGAITTEKLADNSVTPEKTTFFDVEKSSNRLDLSKITLNKYMYIDGNVSDNEAYTYTDFIPVKEGEKITFQSGEIESSLIREMRFICAFDENKNVLSDKGNANTNTLYIVPDGVAYIIITSGSEVFQENIYPRIVNSETIIAYEPYGASSKLKNEYIDKEYIKDLAQETFNENTNIEIVDIKDLSFTESNNLFNKDSSKNKSGFYAYEGGEYANESYYLTDYIEVEPNLIYTFNSNGGEYPYAEQYDSNKVFITNSISRDSFKIFTKQNAKYVRLSIRIDQVDSACFSKGNVAISGTKYEKLIPEKYILKENIDAFTPDEIVVAVGRTIEIYNKQVCPNAEKYHFNWVCNVGKNLKRKFSITGTSGNIGNYTLTLKIYDDKWNLIFIKNSILKIVSSLNSSVSVCPIGDSLTNGKYWLNEVRNLSNNLVSFVGTRGTVNGLKHEGRSGFTSNDYLSATPYLYENEGIQPFWDSTNRKFSWSYYKQTTGINPNMVQIFLGTNDFAGNVTKEQFTANIRTMIDSIRENDSSIPILIVLTICWGNQDGIGKQGNTDGFATYIGMNEYEINRRTILNLQYLYDALQSLNYNNLYFVPLTECHDSEYNFGAVETPVNPRASQTELTPNESVHPQQQGYEQMADVIYSVISYIKSL